MKTSSKEPVNTATSAVKTRRLEGRIALVTGAAGGIGSAVSARLAAEGAAVAVHYRSRDKEAAELVERIRDAGGIARAYRADVTNAKQIRAMVAKINSELGPPDILVNNAAIFSPGDLETFDLVQFEKMQSTNVYGVVNVTQAVVDGMMKAGFGRIVNLTSVAGIGTAFPGTTFYGATKAALAIMTRRFAMDLGQHGITVNAVAPGYILVGMNTRGRKQKEIDATAKTIIPRTMMRRVGWGEDIAAAIAYLVSPEAGYVTAQVLTVDGGRLDYISHV